MGDVLFYHLTESRLEEALPDLLERSLGRGWRALVQCVTEERRDALDAHLWTFRDDSFLPHGRDGEPNAADQPVLLTLSSGAGLNAPQVRFMVEGAIADTLEGLERGIYLFDGHDADQVDDARGRWAIEKAAGHSLTYWQQNEDRRWIKKA